MIIITIITPIFLPPAAGHRLSFRIRNLGPWFPRGLSAKYLHLSILLAFLLIVISHKIVWLQFSHSIKRKILHVHQELPTKQKPPQLPAKLHCQNFFAHNKKILFPLTWRHPPIKDRWIALKMCWSPSNPFSKLADYGIINIGTYYSMKFSQGKREQNGIARSLFFWRNKIAVSFALLSRHTAVQRKKQSVENKAFCRVIVAILDCRTF